MLIDLARSSILQERSRALQLCESHLMQSNFLEIGPISTYVLLHDATANYCDDRRSYLGKDRLHCIQMFIEVYKTNLNALFAVSNEEISRKSTFFSHSRYSLSSRRKCIFLLNQLCKIRFELLYFVDYDELPGFADDFIDSIQDLIDFIDMNEQSNMHYVLHKKGLFYSALATFAQENGDWGSAINHGLNSVDELGDLLQQVSLNDIDFPIFVSDYINAIWTLSRAYKMVGRVKEALNWAKIALINAKEFYTSYSGEERLIVNRLSKFYIMVAMLQNESNAAIQTFLDMNVTLSKYTTNTMGYLK